MLFSKASLLILIAPLLMALTHAQDESCSTADRARITALRQQQFGNGTSVGTACACKLLTDFFGSQVLLSNGTAYETQATHYYDLRADLTPGCIFVPATANDVAVGVVILHTCQSQFAVRGAGHMPVVGAANTDGGVLVALSSFTTTTIYENTIEAGPGLRWYDINVALEPQGRMVVGGRMKTIGIAGLTLGGGMSYFNAQYGFTMDNVVAYDVVLSNGSVVTASPTNNTDLFWALKGGGNNYGIVTKFTYATYPAPSVSTTIQSFAQDEVPTFIEAIADLALYQDQVDTGAGGIFTISWAPSTNSYTGAFLGVQIGDVEQPAVFSNFTAIPSEYAVYNVTTLAAWSSMLDTPYQQSRTMFGMHVAVATNETMQAMYNYWTAATSQMADITGFGTTLVFQPLPPSTAAVAQNNGIGNTWSLPVNSYVFWEIETMWINESDDAAVEAWAQSTIEAIHAANVEAGVGESLIYYNDAADYQDAFAGFPADNLAKMKDIRAKYDPSLVFTNLCSGGFKLDHAPNAP